MKISTLLLTVVLFIASCNNDKKSTTEETASSTTTTNTTVNIAADSAAIRKTITDFYDWYNRNWAKFSTTGLYKGEKKPDMPPYKIDWPAVEKYHQFIKDSVPQLGNTFIEEQKKFFQQCDIEFKKDTEGEIPYGFDYDWYTNSQEDPQYLIDEINKAQHWKTIVTGDDATVEVIGWREVGSNKTEETIIQFGMKKEAGKWTIARIGTP